MAAKLPLVLVLFSLFLTSAFSLRLLAEDLIEPNDQCRGSRQQLQRCRQQCTQGQRGQYQDVRRCMEQCESRMEGQRGEFGLEIGEEYLQGEGRYPQHQYQQCRMRCQRQGSGHSCERRCERQLEDPEFEFEQGQRRHHMRSRRFEDPEFEFQQCRRRCQRQGGSRCDERCERQMEQGPRRHDIRSRRFEDPEFEFEQCRTRCQRQGGSRCHERCERETEQGPRRHDIRSRRFEDPEFQFEQGGLQQCRIRCQRQGGGRQECQEHCQRQIRRQRGIDWEEDDDVLEIDEQEMADDVDEETNPMRRDPERELRQCRRRCHEQGEGYRCEQRCEERSGHHQQGRREPERQYERCQRRCEREERGQGQQWQCQRRCQEQFQRQQRHQSPPRGSSNALASMLAIFG